MYLPRLLWRYSLVFWEPELKSSDLALLEEFGRRIDVRPGPDENIREVLMRTLLRIRDKQGDLAPLVLNRAQREYESRCGKKNIELKAHMRWLVGNGNEGKMQELEVRIQRNESQLQRLGGIGAAVGVLITLLQLAFAYLRVHKP